MAIRNIREMGDAVLNKTCKEVKEVTGMTKMLIQDMFDTMYEAQGVGLAAPQVGVLKRVFVMDVGDGVVECINPVIKKTSGKQRVMEGCLSCPEKCGYVTRPNKCRLKAQDRNGRTFELNLSELGAQCACHESEHLDGKLFIDIVEEFVRPEEE